MHKRLAAGLLEGLAGLMEQELDEARALALIERLRARLKSRTLSEEATRDLRCAKFLLNSLELVAVERTVNLDAKEGKDGTQGVNGDWYAAFRREGAIKGGVCLAGSGAGLRALLEAPYLRENEAAVREALEKLLRHVEAKRQGSLQRFSPPLGRRQAWRERCDVSALFSRAARQLNDLRLLNAAFKLNGWLARGLGLGWKDMERAGLLLALAEAEISARELLR